MDWIRALVCTLNWRQKVYENYNYNLQQICAICIFSV